MGSRDRASAEVGWLLVYDESRAAKASPALWLPGLWGPRASGVPVAEALGAGCRGMDLGVRPRARSAGPRGSGQENDFSKTLSHPRYDRCRSVPSEATRERSGDEDVGGAVGVPAESVYCL